MAQLLLVTSKTKKNNNNIGDVVGVFPDDHKFSEKEKSLFTIVQLDKEKIDSARPERRMMYLEELTDEWKVLEKQPLYELKYNPQTKEISHNLSGVTAEAEKTKIKEKLIATKPITELKQK